MLLPLNLNDRRGAMRRLISAILNERVEIAFATELGVYVDETVAGLYATTIGSLIREFDGGLSRADAELLARNDTAGDLAHRQDWIGSPRVSL